MRRIVAIVWICLFSLLMWAQRDTTFWVAVPSLAEHSSDASLRLYIFTEDAPAEVVVSMPADSSFAPQVLHVAPHTHVDWLLARDYADYLRRIAAPADVVSNRGLHIAASAPVTCYCQLTGVNGEAFVPRGAIALGTDFRVAMQNRYPNAEIETSVYRDAFASVQVVATEDDTEVTLGERVVHLQRGQVYSYRSSDKLAAAHLTGLSVRANRPVSVFSTDDSPSPHPGISGEDAVIDQMLPVAMAGTDYIAVGRGLSWEGCFVQALKDSADVVYGEGETFSLKPYETQYVPLGRHHASMRIHASSAVQVFQISGYWNEMGGVLLPDIYHSGSQRVQYRRMADSRHTSLNIIMPSADTASLNIACRWQPVWGDSTWSFAVVDMSDVVLDSLIVVETVSGAFHLGIVDATSAVEQDERPIMTSASYSYFSSYCPPTDSTFSVPTDSVLLPRMPQVNPSDSSRLQRKKQPIHHSLACYGEGGYSHLPLYAEGVHFSRGYAAGAGLVYELENGHFLLQTGAGVRWQDAHHRMNPVVFVREDNDTQHSDNRVAYRTVRTDCARTLSVDLPVLLGGCWRVCYLLGGVRVGVPVYGQTRMQSLSTTMAQYDQYYDVFSDMANHGLRTQVAATQRGARLPYPVDLRLCLEWGVRLGERVRLSMFGEYGALLPAVSKTGAPLIDFDTHYNMQSWPMAHVSLSDWSKDHETHTFTAGLRLTYRIWNR